MLVERKFLEVGLEDLALYDNILRSRITKVATRPVLFPCAEFIGWIFPRIDIIGMMMNDVMNKGFSSFALAFLSATYNFPEKEVRMETEWVKSLQLNYVVTTKMMIVEKKTFRHK